MRILAFTLGLLFWLPAVQAATVPDLDFEISVSWDFEDKVSEYRNLFTNDLVSVNPDLIVARSGFTFRTDDASAFDGISGTTVAFFGGSHYFVYDFATGIGSATNFNCCYVDTYNFGPGGGMYEYEDDDDPNFLIESARLTNVTVVIDPPLSNVPLPAGGVLLLTGLLGLGVAPVIRRMTAAA